MSRETSASAGKPYGLQRVCRVLDIPRATIYAQEQRQAANVVPLQRARRGPKPKVSDADLLAAIRADLAASPFTGEGYRKVRARLRALRDIRVGRSRVLRLMRENQLLSPHRRPQGAPVAHDGTITTDRPNVMWGTDGMRIETVEDGWVWVFSAVDHYDAFCVGIHAVKIGNRFAALQPIAQGLKAEFGATGADAGRGLILRMDNGTQYTADDFLNQVKFWGIRAELRLCRRAADQWCSRAFQPDVEGAGDPRSPLPQPGGGARRRDRVQGSLQSPLASRETGLHVTPRSPSGLCHAKGGLSCKTVSR
jgi:putative transposase